jgi:large repetitive protein
MARAGALLICLAAMLAGSSAWSAEVIVVNPPSLPSGMQGSPYNQPIIANDSDGEDADPTSTDADDVFTYAVTAGALPPGLTLGAGPTAAGVPLSGTPSAAGTYNFTVTATSGDSSVGSTAYTLIISPPPLTINPPSLPAATVNAPYNQTITASGGTGPYNYIVLSGSLPPGLSLNATTGVISGSPTAGGSYNFTIQASDQVGNTGTRAYTLNVGTNSLAVNPPTLPAGTQNVAYNQTVTASGGTGPYTFALTSGALPTGLSLNASTGAITGTPTGSGTSNFTIQATDSIGDTGSRAYAVNIGTSSLTVNPPSLPAGTQNVAYNQTVSASGGTGPYTFALTSGALPAGLSLNASTGAITGTPTGSGTSNFTIQATDSIGDTGSRAYAVNIGTSSLTVNPSSLPAATQNVPYNQTVSASGGTGPYTFALTSGALPTGLSLNAGTGAITGTPTGSGTSNFTIQATDSIGDTGSRAYTLNVGTNSLAVNPPTLPAGTQNVAYNQTVTASGGTGPYTFALTSGSLPTGLSLNAGTGAITGTPTGSGTSNFTIQATDSIGDTGSRAYAVNIGTNALTVNPSSLPAGTQNVAYNQTVSASGGTGPYTFSVASGALPAGLSLNPATGAITGTPTGSGASSFTIAALDSKGNTGSRPYTINIGTNTLTLNPATLPNGSQNVPYSQTLVGSGGTAPYTYSLTSGTLPAGLTLNPATGAITGTPTGSGQSVFTAQARDVNGNTGSRSYAVNIGTNSLTLNPPSLPPAPQGTPYRQTIVASGGATPYVYTLASGTLPPGLSLNSATGVISGTPTAIGNYSFTILARDINGNFGSRNYTIGTARLDPTLDADVRGLIAAQAAAARRFAQSQVSNVMQHLQGLHDDFDPCANNVAIGISTATTRQMIDPFGQPTAMPLPGEESANAEVARRMPPSEECKKDRWWAPNYAFWAGGSIELGLTSQNGLAVNNRFSTAGVTAGVDVRVTDTLIIGGAFGYGSDHTDIGTAGTSADSRSLSGIAYASYQPFASWFVDGMLGYGYLDFDSRRFVALDSSSVMGTRTGGSWFGSLGLSTEIKFDPWRILPYVRADFMTASLDGYSEQGPTNQALTFGSTSVSSVSAVLGVRAFYDIGMAWGVLTPTLRAEFRHALDDGFNQTMYYTDLGSSLSYGLAQSADSQNLFTAAIGLRARIGGSGSVDVEYGTTAGPGSPLTQSFRGTARIAF